jgi:hypothetical protein
LIDGFNENLEKIRQYIRNLVETAAIELVDHCSYAFQTFETSATEKISGSLNAVYEVAKIQDAREIRRRVGVVDEAVACLPAPSKN